MEKKFKLYKKLGATLIDKGIWFLKTAHNVKVKKIITWKELVDILNKKYKVPRDKIICADGEYHLTDWQTWQSLIEYDWTDKRKYRKAVYDCFMPDTPLIIKENGKVTIKQIQEIEEYPENVEVLDINNKWTRVNWVKSKKTEKDIAVVMSDSGFIETTSDHKFFNGQDFIEISKVNNLQDIVKLEDYSFLSENQFDSELAYAFGVFLAEGNCNYFKTSTTQHGYNWHIDMGELWVLERIKPVLEKYTGVNMKIVLYPSQKKGSIRGGIKSTRNLYRLKADDVFGSTKKLVEIFRDKFYAKNGDKKIPDEILHADKKSKIEFIKGFFDGDAYRVNEFRYQVSCKSRIALYGLIVIAKSIGIRITTYYDKRVYGGRKECPMIVFNLKEGRGITTRRYIKKTNNETIVYDLNTDSGHLFAGGYLVHNCDNFAGSFSARMAEIYGLNTAGLAKGIKIIDATTKKVIGYHRANLIIAIDKGEIKAFGYEPETDGWNELTYNHTQIWNWLYYYNYFEFN